MIDGPYLADGRVVSMKPVHEPYDGGTTITIGFPVCTMTEYCADQADTVAALMNLGDAAARGAQPIDEKTPEDRRILLWSPTRHSWRFGRWNDDRYARKPRPFWDYDGMRIMESREHPPTHWRDEPPAVDDNPTRVGLIKTAVVSEDAG